MKIVTRITILLCLLMTTAWAQADTASQKLADLLGGYDSFSARFEQFTNNNNGRRGQESRGQLQLAKPNLFYWDTQQPFPQTIVSDGKYIWVYDPDLEQVTRKPASRDSNATAMLLNGQITELEQQFTITNPVNTGHEMLFDLSPKGGDEGVQNSNFNRIRLFFVGNLLTELMLEDQLGQRTTVLLSKQQVNPDLDKNHFSFVPPEGVDLILEDEL